MIDSDIRLYTWVDVKDVLLGIKPDKLPKWLVWARCYWDELSIGISVGKKTEAKNWLKKVFGSRFRVCKTEEITDFFMRLNSLKIQGNYEPKFKVHKIKEAIEYFIVLESLKTPARNLPIWLEETEQKAPTPQLKPSISRPEVIWFEHQNIDIPSPKIFPSNIPPIVAFHSFKGLSLIHI